MTRKMEKASSAKLMLTYSHMGMLRAQEMIESCLEKVNNGVVSTDNDREIGQYEESTFRPNRTVAEVSVLSAEQTYC